MLVDAEGRERWPRVGAMKSCYLRFHFDDVHQLGEHLHVVSGRTLFFFGSLQLPLQRGDRVLLEVDWGEQQAVLRGTVHSRVDGRGVWLEFPDAKLAGRAAAQGALGARRQRRLPVDLMVEVKPQHGRSLVGRLLDVSLGGARVVGIRQLNEGAEIELQLLVPVSVYPPALGRAKVVRAGAEAAVRFLRKDPSSPVAMSKLFEAARQAWAQADELTHPRTCCRGRGANQPPVPQVRALW